MKSECKMCSCFEGRWLLLLTVVFALSACSNSPASKQGMTPFLLAAKAGDIEQMKSALTEGADLDETSAYGWTALMFAAWQGHADVVEMLLDAGANPNLVSSRIAKNTQAPLEKTTALAQALENDHFTVARLLMNRGATADAVSVAIAGGLEDLSILKEMHAAGAKLSDNYGNLYHSSPMRMACQQGRLVNVQWLVAQGVEPGLSDLKVAIGRGHFEIVKYFLESDSDLVAFSKQAISEAFVFAATLRSSPDPEANLQIIDYLLGQGADPGFRPDSGQVKGKTAVEFLNKKCLLAKELIEKNRYGAPQQAADQAWLDHMKSVIRIIEPL